MLTAPGQSSSGSLAGGEAGLALTAEPGPLAWPCVSLSPAQHAVHTQQAPGLRAPNRRPEVPRLPASAVPTPRSWCAELGLPVPPGPQSLPSQQPLLLTAGVGGRVEGSGERPPRALQDGRGAALGPEGAPALRVLCVYAGESPAGPWRGRDRARGGCSRKPWPLRLGAPLGPGLPSQEGPLEPGIEGEGWAVGVFCKKPAQPRRGGTDRGPGARIRFQPSAALLLSPEPIPPPHPCPHPRDQPRVPHGTRSSFPTPVTVLRSAPLALHPRYGPRVSSTDRPPLHLPSRPGEAPTSLRCHSLFPFFFFLPAKVCYYCGLFCGLHFWPLGASSRRCLCPHQFFNNLLS